MYFEISSFVLINAYFDDHAKEKTGNKMKFEKVYLKYFLI
jgi:hypothetical protein